MLHRMGKPSRQFRSREDSSCHLSGLSWTFSSSSPSFFSSYSLISILLPYFFLPMTGRLTRNLINEFWICYLGNLGTRQTILLVEHCLHIWSWLLLRWENLSRYLALPCLVSSYPVINKTALITFGRLIEWIEVL